MYKVIIADDEPFIRTGLLYRNPWHEMGFEVVAMKEDGSEVLQFLEEERADVLLTDICMLRVSGLEVAGIVREKYPWMKVVLLSGYQEFEYAREAIRHQVCDYLLKPVECDQLQELFARIKMELDENSYEERLMQRMDKENYDQLLALTKEVTGSVLGEGDESWLTYARMKAILNEAPEEIRKVFLKYLLAQLQKGLKEKDEKIAEEFAEQIWKLSLNEEDENQTALLSLFRRLNDKLMAKGILEGQKLSSSKLIAKACDYINNHLSDECSYHDVAEFIHVSPRHFLRLFHSERKEKFADYMVRVRIDAAKSLLDETTISITEVASAVGYSDAKYFQQIFKKSVGCTMKEYRKREKT